MNRLIAISAIVMLLAISNASSARADFWSDFVDMFNGFGDGLGNGGTSNGNGNGNGNITLG
jgi:hypothetical protein